ncbi:MAG: hypothetical protein U0931_21170 [Vulcanimicrobiota bacterium]
MNPDFRDRVPPLDQINRTNRNLTRSGEEQAGQEPERDDPRSWFDEQGAARRRQVDDIRPEDQSDG